MVAFLPEPSFADGYFCGPLLDAGVNLQSGFAAVIAYHCICKVGVAGFDGIIIVPVPIVFAGQALHIPIIVRTIFYGSVFNQECD